MGALMGFLYGIVAYVSCLTALLYLIGFSGNLFVPTSVDRGMAVPSTGALIADSLLLGLFALQHSVMARKGFKRLWTRVVPPTLERSTYVLAASITLGVLFWQWRPIPMPMVWQIDNPVMALLLWTIFGLGWVLVLVSTFLIDHFELFGLRQVSARLTGRGPPTPRFVTPLLYRQVRHPLYAGILLALWSVPAMTAGHLLFSIGCTGYILVGIWFEERDLVAQFGERYRRYRDEVGMLVPRWGHRSARKASALEQR